MFSKLEKSLSVYPLGAVALYFGFSLMFGG